MTAGLHHKWRRRAVDLAAVGPGSRVLDVATGTGDLAVELAGRVAPGGEVVGSDFSEGMLELARAKAPGITFEQGNALDLPYEDDRFDAATVGFGARNFSDLDEGAGRDGARRAPGRTRRRARDHDAHRARRCRRSSACGSIGSSRCSAVWAGTPMRTATCRARCAASRARPSSPRRWAAGLEHIRWLLTAGGIIAIHVGEVRA